MADGDEVSRQPAFNGATRSYIVIAGVCFFIVVLLVLGYAQEEAAKKQQESMVALASGAPATGQPDTTEEQAARNKRVADLVQKSKGKFESLDKEEQEYLNGLTSGHGSQMVRMRWQALNGSAGAANSSYISPEKKVMEVIERTGGDFSKVTEVERSHMNSFTNGYGKEYFESRTKAWKESLKGTKEKTGSSSPIVNQK